MQWNDDNVDRKDFVGRTVAELIRRGNKCPGSGDTSPMDTLRWFDYFVEFFLPGRGEDEREKETKRDGGAHENDTNDRSYSHDEEDDILYFVPASQSDEQGSSPSAAAATQRLLVRRRPVTGALPSLDAVIQWEETFVINLLARLHCRLRLTVLETNGRIVHESRHRVYADPMRGPEYCYRGLLQPGRHESEVETDDDPSSPSSSSFCPAYPMIYFHCHGVDETSGAVVAPGQTLCVELLALFRWGGQLGEHGKETGSKGMDARASPSAALDRSYVAWRTGPDRLPLFQGAVSYEALKRVHRKKVGLHLGAPSGILMRGPSLNDSNSAGMDGDKSFAQLVVNTVDAPSLPVHLWRKLLRRGSGTATAPPVATATTTALASPNGHNSGKRSLQCQLRFIYMNWRPLTRAIFRHRHSASASG